MLASAQQKQINFRPQQKRPGLLEVTGPSHLSMPHEFSCAFTSYRPPSSLDLMTKGACYLTTENAYCSKQTEQRWTACCCSSCSGCCVLLSLYRSLNASYGAFRVFIHNISGRPKANITPQRCQEFFYPVGASKPNPTPNLLSVSIENSPRSPKTKMRNSHTAGFAKSVFVTKSRSAILTPDNVDDNSSPRTSGAAFQEHTP